MREIKLRAWHILLKKYIAVGAIDFTGGTIRKNDPCIVDDKENGGCYLLSNCEIEHYIGRKDKTGAEMAEGDVILFKDHFHGSKYISDGVYIDKWDAVCIVKWNPEECRYSLTLKNGNEHCFCSNHWFCLSGEIIGTIHG